MNYRWTFIGLFLLALLGVAGEKKLVILQTSDVHGRMGHEKNGWLKLATLIKQERLKASNHCLYIDCGDSVQGTLGESISRGGSSLAALNHLKPDAWIPGNHEFDFGTTRLGELITAAQFPVLNGNVTLKTLKKPTLDGYKIVHVNGLKIAIIGLNTGRLKTWFWGKDYDQFTVSPAVDYLEKTLPEIQKQSPNLIILGIHQGLLAGRHSNGEVFEICKRFPQIDLLFGGHTHEAIPGKRVWGCFVVQPGEHGEYLSRATVTFNDDGAVKQILSSLLDATKAEPDAELAKVLEPFTGKAKREAFKVIAQAPSDVSAAGVPGVNNAMSDLFCRAVKQSTGADAVLHGAHNELSWKKGPVYSWQLFASIPYENAICVVTVAEPELKKIIEEQLSFSPREHMQGIYGTTIVVGRDGKTVERIEMPEGKRTISLALTDFCIAGGGWRYPVLRETLLPQRPAIKQLNISTRSALTSYLQTTPAWHHPPKKWLVFPTK